VVVPQRQRRVDGDVDGSGEESAVIDVSPGQCGHRRSRPGFGWQRVRGPGEPDLVGCYRAPRAPGQRLGKVGDGPLGRSLDTVIELARQWPADFLLIETERHRPVRVTAGAARTTPLYLACKDGILNGSWDIGRLRGFAVGLNPKEATRMLAYHPRYSCETVFTGIWRLTERATATFAGNLYIRYPDPVPHATPRELADGADVLTAFAGAIDAALGLRPLDPGTTTFHLTGGLDSGSLATSAARRYPGVLNTATLIITGPGREHQVRRRSEIRSRVPFGPHDVQVDTGERLMFGPDCDRASGGLVSPYDEPLYAHMTELNSRIAALGARVVVSGLGGDEMVAVGSAESRQAAIDKTENFDLPWLGPVARTALSYGDDQIAPPAMAGGITLLAAECVAPPLLRAGLWPLHPFAEPPLVTLGDQLPFHWRELKQLQRRHLATFGLSEAPATLGYARASPNSSSSPCSLTGCPRCTASLTADRR
jgi:hypothetical protein